MRRRITGFISKQDGVVTIEWVGIAGIAFLAAVVIAGTLLSGANNLGGAVSGQMDAAADDINGGGS